MKNVLMVLAIAAAIGFSGMALAKDKKEGGKAAGLKGKITKIDGTKITVNNKKTGDVIVVTDDNTKVTVDDKPAAMADLKEGEMVSVTPETGTATLIAVHTKRGKGGAPSTAPAGGDAK